MPEEVRTGIAGLADHMIHISKAHNADDILEVINGLADLIEDAQNLRWKALELDEREYGPLEAV